MSYLYVKILIFMNCVYLRVSYTYELLTSMNFLYHWDPCTSQSLILPSELANDFFNQGCLPTWRRI